MGGVNFQNCQKIMLDRHMHCEVSWRNMRTSRNWKAVKTEFVTGDISNVAEFARMKGIPPDTINKHSKGWLQEQAEHRQNISIKIEEKDIEEKVIDSEKRKQHMTTVIDGTLDQWRKLNAQLAEMEIQMQGQAPNMKMLQDLRKAHNATTKILPELIRVMELLDGGATARTDTVVKGKRTKDMTEKELHDAEEELAKEVLKRGDE